MKKLLKIIIPKFIYNRLSKSVALRNYLRKNNFILHQSHIGMYADTTELKKDLKKKNFSQTIGNNDQNHQHVEVQIKKNINNANDFLNDKKISWNERESFLCHALTLFPKKEINVLDIGGGLKPCYFTLKNSLPHKIKCHVIEFENIVKGSKKIYENIEDLTYSTEFPKNMNFDVIYFGSSIQYFDNLNFLFEKIIDYKPNLIAFSYTSFAENHKTFTTGTYTFHRKFITPATIYNINDFIEFFSKNNYLLKHKSIMKKIDLSFQDSLGVKTRVYNLVFQNSQ